MEFTYIRCYYCLSCTSMKISIARSAYAFIVLCGIVYAFVVLRGPNGIPALLEKRRQVHEYEMSNQQLQREIEQKQERIIRLQKDPDEQEIEIRQRLKYAEPGEKVYIIDDSRKK